MTWVSRAVLSSSRHSSLPKETVKFAWAWFIGLADKSCDLKLLQVLNVFWEALGLPLATVFAFPQSIIHWETQNRCDWQTGHFCFVLFCLCRIRSSSHFTEVAKFKLAKLSLFPNVLWKQFKKSLGQNNPNNILCARTFLIPLNNNNNIRKHLSNSKSTFLYAFLSVLWLQAIVWK